MLTLTELCEKYHLSEQTVTTQFVRTQKSIYKKYGVEIKKVGRGKSAYYEEEGREYRSDGRASTMFNEEKQEIALNNESLNLLNADFLMFLGIVSTPMGMFRGTPQDFLQYIGVKTSDENLEMLEDSLLGLVDRGLICYDVDEDTIILYVRRRVEQEMKLGIQMVKHCRELAIQHKKQQDGWLKLLKVWVAVQICYEDQPFTIKRLAEMTNLSQDQVKDAKKILEDDDLFKTSRAGRGLICKGSNVELNAFYN